MGVYYVPVYRLSQYLECIPRVIQVNFAVLNENKIDSIDFQSKKRNVFNVIAYDCNSCGKIIIYIF